MAEKYSKSLKRFTHGGPRRGVAYELEKARAALRRSGLDEQQFPLRAVAKQCRLSQRNLYFRLRRHRIPYRIGPKEGSPGRQVWVPESSLPLIVEAVWKLSQVAARILKTPVSSGPVRSRGLIT